MHAESLNLNIEELIEAKPIQPIKLLTKLLWIGVLIGTVAFTVGLFSEHPAHMWGAFYTNLLFFMGLAAGGVMISVIFQIVRAQWSPPVRRLAEANVAFLPWAYFLFLITYFGKDHLFYWATHPMPGREWWMQPDFVYARFALLLPILFYLMHRFVQISLRGDVGLIRERARGAARWGATAYDRLTRNWRGAAVEVPELQRRLSVRAPVVVLAYALIYSLFAFEMIMAMNPVWMSNLFGAFIFVGNIYIGWAVLGLMVIFYDRTNADYSKTISTHQLWDLGKLTYGFCFIWGYFFFSQFLPQWYGNLPEETQWMILRTREGVWHSWGWVTFSLCLIIPFILLLSRNIKKTPKALAVVLGIIFIGMWTERYLIVMPEISPESIPFGFMEVALFVGFLGAYLLSYQDFLSRYPSLPVSSPLTRGSIEW